MKILPLKQKEAKMANRTAYLSPFNQTFAIELYPYYQRDMEEHHELIDYFVRMMSNFSLTDIERMRKCNHQFDALIDYRHDSKTYHHTGFRYIVPGCYSSYNKHSMENLYSLLNTPATLYVRYYDDAVAHISSLRSKNHWQSNAHVLNHIIQESIPIVFYIIFDIDEVALIDRSEYFSESFVDFFLEHMGHNGGNKIPWDSSLMNTLVQSDLIHDSMGFDIAGQLYRVNSVDLADDEENDSYFCGSRQYEGKQVLSIVQSFDFSAKKIPKGFLLVRRHEKHIPGLCLVKTW